MRGDLTRKEWLYRTFEGERWRRDWDDAAAGLIVLFFIAVYAWIHWQS